MRARKSYTPEYKAKTSMRDYRRENWLINIPLYAIGTDFLDE
jgi:hypothetical protein